jgi:hypothetical protein
VVVATSADIQAHWEQLVGELDMGSPDSGLAQGFYDPNTNTVFLIADHIEAGQEMAAHLPTANRAGHHAPSCCQWPPMNLAGIPWLQLKSLATDG